VAEPLAEFDAWLDHNWDPGLTVREWWERLGTSGWAAPHWPRDACGRGLSTGVATQVRAALRQRGALGPPGGLGLLLAGPTIYTHGTPDQQDRFLPDIVCGRVAWCQLFSEPLAGSDLAGLQTRATLEDDLWRVNGQKVWTSSGHLADFGMLLARTDVNAPKHRGITYLLVDMHQPGVEVRPLREMTGRALFNEVFLTDVVVRDEDVLGRLGFGWAVAKTTLAFERAGLGAGSASGAELSAFPGTVAGHLDRRAGDFVRPSSGRRAATLSVNLDVLVDLVRRRGRAADPLVRQRIAKIYTVQRIGSYMALRAKDLRATGAEVPGWANVGKLQMSEIFRQARELGLDVLGPRGMLHAYDGRAPSSDEDLLEMSATGLAVWSPGPSIYGGTDQVQRNILAERVLGLQRDVLDDPSTPFKDLRKNV
jgi:alkylation response protein AidB-like acyl-CoA dehydrogenase